MISFFNPSRILLLAVTLFTGLTAMSQGNLQFNQALILDNTLQTVPDGKVWKVTAIYGAQEVCVNRNNAENTTWTWRNLYITNFFVNGTEIRSQEIDFRSRLWCSSSTCASCILNWPNDKYDLPANPNIMPFWVPEGATVQSGGSNIFLSALEFNIIP